MPLHPNTVTDAAVTARTPPPAPVRARLPSRRTGGRTRQPKIEVDETVAAEITHAVNRDVRLVGSQCVLSTRSGAGAPSRSVRATGAARGPLPCRGRTRDTREPPLDRTRHRSRRRRTDQQPTQAVAPQIERLSPPTPGSISPAVHLSSDVRAASGPQMSATVTRLTPGGGRVGTNVASFIFRLTSHRRLQPSAPRVARHRGANLGRPTVCVLSGSRLRAAGAHTKQTGAGQEREAA